MPDKKETAGVKVEKISSFIYEFISACVPGEDILLNEPMSRHTTFKVGGEAGCLVRISETGQIARIVSYLRKVGIPYFVIGNGSNLLVGDKGYPGVILQIGSRMNQLTVLGNHIRAQAGVSMIQAARCAQENGLTGLEFASGIPGTVGGGTVMNAGAYGGELKQVVKKVTVMDEQGEILEICGEDMEFGYRTSIIKNRPFIVLEVLMDLNPGNKEEVRSKMEDLAKKRREKQPLEFASAGSTFKRPEGYFAGKLIMDAGLRGFAVGGARVSEKHCGFVVNTGTASAADIAQVIKEVQRQVKDKFGVTLEREVIFLGDF